MPNLMLHFHHTREPIARTATGTSPTLDFWAGLVLGALVSAAICTVVAVIIVQRVRRRRRPRHFRSDAGHADRAAYWQSRADVPDRLAPMVPYMAEAAATLDAVRQRMAEQDGGDR